MSGVSPVKTVLVVEDDTGIQSLLKDALEPVGFAVHIEKDGDSGKRALDRRLPDVLITDVLLPGLGGFELIEELRQRPGGDKVPVVVISGIYKGARHRKAGEKLGVIAYFDKPFDVAAVVDAVRGASGGAARSASRAASGVFAAPRAGGTGDVVQRTANDATRAAAERATQAAQAARNAKGNLTSTSFPDVLALLHRGAATGALLLRRGSVKKIVYVQDGAPVFVKSNVLSECLGRILVREKMITEAECERSLVVMKENTKPQGQVLIEMGSISPHNLVFGLQLQLEEKLFDIFGWPDGDFQFSPTLDVPTQTVHVDRSVPTLIHDGVHRKYLRAQLDQAMSPLLDHVLAINVDATQRFEDLEIEEEARSALTLIDGTRSVSEFLKQSGLSRFDASALIVTLLATQMVDVQPRGAKPAKPVGRTEPDARTRAATVPPPLPPAKRDTAPSTLPAMPAAVVGPSSDDVHKALAGRVRALRKQSPFEVLGVSQSASNDELTRAHFALQRELRNLVTSSTSPETRALIDTLTQQLTSAYESVIDGPRRSDVQRRLERAPRVGGVDDLSRTLAADTRFRKGEGALGKSLWDQAVVHFAAALELLPDDAEVHAHLGWALFQQAPDDVTHIVDALARIDQALEKSPTLDSAHLFRGRVLLAQGRTTDARAAFERALACNPECEDARVALEAALSSSRQGARV